MKTTGFTGICPVLAGLVISRPAAIRVGDSLHQLQHQLAEAKRIAVQQVEGQRVEMAANDISYPGDAIQFRDNRAEAFFLISNGARRILDLDFNLKGIA